MKIHFWMNAANDMHFSLGLVVVFLNDVEHIVHAQFPTFLSLSVQPGVRTEMAGENANIRRFNMKIAIEIHTVAVHLFANVVGEGA
jgi:hypothetical protein